MLQSWAFEQRAIAAGVRAPRPVPNQADGGCLAWVSRRDPALPEAAVRLHQWTQGDPVGPGIATPEIATWAGRTLATLHGLRIRPQDRTVFPFHNTDTADRWPELTAAARLHGASWAELMAEAATAVSLIAELGRSVTFLPEQEVLSHGDIDQKNLIAGQDGPVLCDWDLAVPVVPRRELADVALSLACWHDAGIARTVVRSYREAGGDVPGFEPPDIGQSLATGLDWIAFNVERAIGLRPATAAESALGDSLLPGLLTRLRDEVSAALSIGDILGP